MRQGCLNGPPSGQPACPPAPPRRRSKRGGFRQILCVSCAFVARWRRPVGVDHPPPGHGAAPQRHHAADLARAAFTQVLRDVAVGHDPARGNLLHDVEHPIGEAVHLSRAGVRGGEPRVTTAPLGKKAGPRPGRTAARDGRAGGTCVYGGAGAPAARPGGAGSGRRGPGGTGPGGAGGGGAGPGGAGPGGRNGGRGAGSGRAGGGAGRAARRGAASQGRRAQAGRRRIPDAGWPMELSCGGPAGNPLNPIARCAGISRPVAIAPPHRP